MIIYDYFKTALLRLRCKNIYGESVIINKGCSISNSSFEGYNTVNCGSCIIKSKFGFGTYIGDDSHISNARVGKFCSIAENVRIVIGNHPTSVFVTTFPSFYYDTESQLGFTYHKGKPIYQGLRKFPQGEKEYQVVIGNDVWIGCNSLILGGVKIGNGAIIGAGAVVTKDVPPYSVVVGVPAKVIKYRFSEEQIEQLEMIKWWNWPIEYIERHYLDFSNIDDFIKKYKEDNEH